MTRRKCYGVTAAALLTVRMLGCAAPRPGPSPSAASPDAPEAVSLLGQPLYPPALAPERRAELEARLAQAREAFEKSPGDPDAIIWLGRRTAYLGRFRDAVAIFSDGIARHPADPRLYRHRGHRYITLRRFDLAESDLERAASLVEGSADEVEPDGIPNARNVPTSTLQSNIWYHLGLARYLQGNFAGARTAYRRGMEVSKNPDTVVAMNHWLYMTLRRLGQEQEAAAVLGPIREGMDVIENGDYYRLLRMYQGKLEPGELLAQAGEPGSVGRTTVAYGVGHWHLYNGREDEAMRTFREVLSAGQWPAFGHIAAEAELKRQDRAPGATRP